jgi:hypothetical protein
MFEGVAEPRLGIRAWLRAADGSRGPILEETVTARPGGPGLSFVPGSGGRAGSGKAGGLHRTDAGPDRLETGLCLWTRGPADMVRSGAEPLADDAAMDQLRALGYVEP